MLSLRLPEMTRVAINQRILSATDDNSRTKRPLWLAGDTDRRSQTSLYRIMSPNVYNIEGSGVIYHMGYNQYNM